MLISVHLPKTAGSSFLVAIDEHFGGRLLRDYGDRPINKSTLRRNLHAVIGCLRNAFPRTDLQQYECIHGHFMPIKYYFLRTPLEKRYVVWMRDPIERLASHYFYWLQNYNPHDAGDLHRRVVEEKWSLERFCLGPEMRNTYSKFFWRFPLDNFHFIGITEFYDEDLKQFSDDVLNAPLEIYRKNVNRRGEQRSYIEAGGLRRKLEAHHSADMALYRHALKLRENRLANTARHN